MITMILGGIWHGASWRMALWGGLHGVGLCLTRMWWWTFGLPPKGVRAPIWRRAMGWVVTFVSVMLARIFFRAESMETAGRMFAGLVPSGQLAEWAAPNLTPRVLVVLAVASALHFGPSDIFRWGARVFKIVPIPARAVALVGIALVIKQVADFEVQTFIYFQF
jgi:D-alanyl-lipoteichoic acid acyltransferase DltB (MBOAT superfamily)